MFLYFPSRFTTITSRNFGVASWKNIFCCQALRGLAVERVERAVGFLLLRLCFADYETTRLLVTAALLVVVAKPASCLVDLLTGFAYATLSKD